MGFSHCCSTAGPARAAAGAGNDPVYVPGFTYVVNAAARTAIVHTFCKAAGNPNQEKTAMPFTIKQWKRGTLAAMLLLLGACTASDGGDEREVNAVETDVVATQPAPGAAAPAAPMPGDANAAARPTTPPDMRLEVNTAARELYVYKGGQRVATHPVAVGSKEWPTQTGEWTINQVIWNPEWIPPAEEWAKDEKRSEPGAEDNPLGFAQLVYDAPRSIHGTNEPSSLGKAVSHGSIRVANDVALKLARQAAEAGGAGKDPSWYEQAHANRTVRQELALPNPIPIRVY